MNRPWVWILLAAPAFLGGCYGSKMLRQPVTVDQTAEDVDAVRQQQAALEERLSVLERQNDQMAEMIRSLRAEEGSRWNEIEERLMAVDSKLRDLLGGSRASARAPSWSAEPAPSVASRPVQPPPNVTGGTLAAAIDSMRSVPQAETTEAASAGGAGSGTPEMAPGGTPGNAAGGASGGPLPPGMSSDSAAVGGPGTAVPGGEAAAKKIYDQAYLDYSRGNYSLAVLGFREFLRQSPSAELADNAQYWIGEAYYAQREFNTAIAEFLKVVEDYPDGDKVPSALLKIGYAYLQTGDRASARRYLKQVIDRFPNAEEAGLARRKLRTAGLD